MKNIVKRKYKNFIKFNPFLNSLFGRKLLQYFIEKVYILEIYKRNKLKRKLITQSKLFIPESEGIALFPPNSFKTSENAVKEAKKIFNIKNNDLDLNSSPKSYLREISLSGHLSQNSPIMDFALDPQILSIVSNYLGTFPVLREVRMMYSPNKGNIEGGSQFFHVDKEYPRMMKIFLFITHSTKEDGPLTALPADKSELIWRDIGSFKSIHRVEDENVFNKYSENDTTAIYGEEGSVGFLDVGRCLHFGSRPNPKSKPRLILWFVYHHYCGDVFPFSMMSGKRFDFKEFADKNDVSKINKSLLF